MTEAPSFRLVRLEQPAAALGVAVNYLMTKPAFANLRFGDWSRVLVGQINRGHYFFAADPSNNIHGFVGWALTSMEKAEAWVEGRRPLSYEDGKDGDCIVFNAWSADSSAVHRFLFNEARRLTQIRGLRMAYFKRYYKDGRTRPARIVINQFVGSHLKAQDI